MPFFGVPIRNGLPIGLGSVAGFGAPQEFSPSELFLGGTAGAWYDPSDLSTMFDTSAGTTPVAMPGQGAAVPVGLMLDKSQGLVLGSELVTNGDFSQGSTGWTAGAAGVTIIGGAVLYISVSSTFTLRQSGVITAEKTYEVQYEITAYTGGTIQAKLNGTVSALGLNRSATGVYKEYITSTSTADGILAFAVSSFTGSIDNISVRELPGNHAISFNNTTARPELRARVNLLTYSEEFDNGAWTKSNVTVTANAAVAPDGTTTADLMYPTTSGLGRSIYQTINNGSLISVYAKASGLSFIAFANTAGSAGAAWFDLSTGAVGTVAAGYTASIEDVGLGWYKCSLEALSGVFTFAQIYTTNSNNSLSVTASGTDGVFLWGADLRPANIGANVPAYQRIADANTYDTSGFPLYLRFDGIDDSMYTPANLNLSGTDKVAVFAGVRKLSDAAAGMVTELSATVASNNGAFAIVAPTAVVANSYNWVSRGTLGVDNAVVNAFTAPVTGVITGIADIAAPVSTNRLNGAVLQTLATTQGTGNFGTYPLYIGSRANSGVWLNGHLHSLIIAGSAVSAGNISATEQWVAGKTGIQI